MRYMQGYMWNYRLNGSVAKAEGIGELVQALYQGGELLEEMTDDLRLEISRYQGSLPLYDIYTNHVFLIHRDNVYPRIVYDKYRMVDEEFFRELVALKNPSESDIENHRFLSYYHIPTLLETFHEVFYQSFVVSSFITRCRRPSFTSKMEHINPYYTINELNYLAYDWGLIDQMTIDRTELSRLCQQIRKHDIRAATLLDHQLYIYEKKAIGLVKHYSLFGSYYINRYLRRTLACLDESLNNPQTIRDPYLENQIIITMNLVKGAPAFRRSHTVYRFVQSDEHLNGLKEGSIYTDPSFTSTTRNPFYYKENYAFGFILIKITLPEGVTGVGLCIESFSNFPSEEEIVLLPRSRYRLDRIVEKDLQKPSRDSDYATGLKVHKKYEFTWVGNDYLSETPNLGLENAYIPEVFNVNLAELVENHSLDHLSISERLQYFIYTYTNTNNQFRSTIGNTTYTFVYEAYDSTSVYRKFFYYRKADGIMLTTSNPRYGNINLLIEIGLDIHVNYYFRYSLTDNSMVVNLDTPEWLEWFSMLAYLIGCRTVVIHPSYTHSVSPTDTDRQKIDKTRYTYPRDIYLYLKEARRLFVSPMIVPSFDYGQLDRLRDTFLRDLIRPNRIELHRLYQSSKIENAHDFYLYLAEKHPKYLSDFQGVLDDFYDTDNPFRQVSYRLDAWAHLYDLSIIRIMPPDKEFRKKGSFRSQIGDTKVVQFTNRLRDFINQS